MNCIIPLSLETPRIQLRIIEEKDCESLFQLYSDPESVKHTLKTPLGLPETWRLLAAMLGHWTMRGYGPYAIVEKTSGKTLGVTGLWQPFGWPETEIKWALARQFWGKGYATEAASAVREMAESHLKWSRLVSFILPENKRSIAVATRLGAKYEKTIPFRNETADVYVHLMNREKK